MRTTMTTIMLTLIGALGLVARGGCQQFTFTIVDFPGSAGYTMPLGINDHGDIAGLYNDFTGAIHGYIRMNGYFSTVDYPGAAQTVAANITANGDITGTYMDTLGFQHGFLRHGDKYSSIDEPLAVQTTGIEFEWGTGLGTAAALHNSQGDTVGEYADANGVGHGWLLSHGQFHTIDVPGQANVPGLGCEAISINDSDAIVGPYYTLEAMPVHGFLLKNGHFTTIDVPGAGGTFGSQSNGINNRGDIVGLYSDPYDFGHGFLLRAGQYINVDYPYSPFTECHGINDNGKITGLFYNWDGSSHGFIATMK